MNHPSFCACEFCCATPEKIAKEQGGAMKEIEWEKEAGEYLSNCPGPFELSDGPWEIGMKAYLAACRKRQEEIEQLRQRVKQLEEGIRKYLAGWDKYHPNRNIYVLEKLIE